MLFDELKTTIPAWMGRTDFDNTKLETAIQICEANYTYGVGDIPPLRVRAMETAISLTVDAESVALPTDCVALRHIYIDYTPKVILKYMSEEVLRETYPDTFTGIPAFYTMEGENIIFAPAPDSSYTAKGIYYKKLTALSNSNTSNWVLANRPDIYLYGAMAELEDMLDGPNVDKWFSKYARAVNATNAQDQVDRHSGSSLVQRIAHVRKVQPR